MNRDMVILKENENYIAFFPGIYHFFPCTKLQSDFLQNGHKQITENRQYQGDKTLSIREFYQKVDIFIKTKADELDNERRIRKNSQAQKDLEIFGKESVRILGRLIMNPSSTCNLMCRYCYAQNYLNGETCRHMSIETARAALENFYRQYDAVRVIHFLGGEPLLNIDVIKYVCSWITKRFKRGIIKMLPVFAIITNGTIVSEEIIKTIKEFKIQVVVSIDGPSDINDKNRVFKNGKGTYHIIREAFHRFDVEGFQPKIQATYTKEHIQRRIRIIDLMHFFSRQFGVTYLHVGLSTGSDKTHAILPQYGELLEEMYVEAIDLIFSSHISGENLFLLQVQDIIDALINKKSIGKLCNCAGDDTAALDTDGRIYPCNYFFNNNNYAEGNLIENTFSFENPKRKNVETRIMTILEKRTDECLSCWAVNFCTACLGDIVYNSSYWSFPDSHCKFIKRIVTKIIFKMAEHRRKTERTMKTETGIKNDL